MSAEKRFDMILGKQRARARLREFIGEHIFDRKNARVLCLPGENGREIEHVYRKLGFRDENIVGAEIDRHAAKGVRTHYPRIDLREGSLLDVVQKIVTSPDEPPFDVVSLDFCGNFTEEKFFPLRFLQMTGKLARRVVVASNLFAGREQTRGQQDLRSGYMQHLIGGASSEELAQFVYSTEAWADHATKQSDNVTLASARDHAARTAMINELTHYGPSCTMSRMHNIAISREDLERTLKSRGVNNESRRHIVPYVMTNPFTMPMGAVLAQTHELYEALLPILKNAPKAFKATIDSNSTPEVVALAWARKVGSAFSDDFGQAHVPIAEAAYSYINDAGHRMVSDYMLFQDNSEHLRRLPQAIAVDTEGGLFLDPDPDDFRPPHEYAQYICKIVQRYHKIPQLWTQGISARVDLGGGALPIDQDGMKEKIVKALKNGRTDDEIMAKYPVTVGTLRALKAHITMAKTPQ